MSIDPGTLILTASICACLFMLARSILSYLDKPAQRTYVCTAVMDGRSSNPAHTLQIIFAKSAQEARDLYLTGRLEASPYSVVSSLIVVNVQDLSDRITENDCVLRKEVV